MPADPVMASFFTRINVCLEMCELEESLTFVIISFAAFYLIA
jgi:hypothetical protein